VNGGKLTRNLRRLFGRKHPEDDLPPGFPKWDDVIRAVRCNIDYMKTDEEKMRMVWVHIKSVLQEHHAKQGG
jgi:hypothetical protein